jgi:uncharacterized protein YjeT (DUF2065 family)
MTVDIMGAVLVIIGMYLLVDGELWRETLRAVPKTTRRVSGLADIALGILLLTHLHP